MITGNPQELNFRLAQFAVAPKFLKFPPALIEIPQLLYFKSLSYFSLW